MEAVTEAWENICHQNKGFDATQPDYLVASYNKDGTVEFIETGHGGADRGGGRGRVVQILGEHESKLLFGVFKVTGVDDRGSTVSFRSKFIHFIHKGASISPMLKGKAGSFQSEMTEPFTNISVSIKGDGDVSDYDESEIESKLLSAGGAHTPTSYDFTNEYADKKD